MNWWAFFSISIPKSWETVSSEERLTHSTPTTTELCQCFPMRLRGSNSFILCRSLCRHPCTSALQSNWGWEGPLEIPWPHSPLKHGIRKDCQTQNKQTRRYRMQLQGKSQRDSEPDTKRGLRVSTQALSPPQAVSARHCSMSFRSFSGRAFHFCSPVPAFLNAGRGSGLGQVPWVALGVRDRAVPVWTQSLGSWALSPAPVPSVTKAQLVQGSAMGTRL